MGCGKLQVVAQTCGCQNGSTRSTRCKKKKTFFKNHPRPHGIQNKCFWHILSSGWPVFGPPKIPKCLENGLFCNQKSVKNGSKKMCFSQGTFWIIWGAQINWNEPISSPCCAISAPLKAKRALKMGKLGITNGSKLGQNHGFPKKNSRPVVVPKRMNTTHFDPLLSRSHPLSTAYLICCCILLDDVPSPTSSVPIFNLG